jgi:ABC-type uncharacterized transport system involved in gliding motility auxiliary subunit
MERKAKAAAETSVYLVVVAAILVVVNIIAYVAIHRRIDVTRNERFTLSQGSARLVGTLKSPIQVDAYVTKGLPKLDAFVRDLTDLLKLYQQRGGSKFQYTIIEAKSEEQRQAAKEAGLKDVAFGEGSETGEDQASIAQGYMGLVFKYGSEKEVIPIIQPDRADGLEFWISNKIREIRDKGDDIHHKIGVITGKDEIKLTDTNLVPAQGGRGGGPSMKGIIDQAFPFYKIEDVDLKDGATEISKDLDGLIITQPGKDYTEKELRRIDEFLMRGNKSLVVFASAVNLKSGDGSMKATLSTHGLEKLLAGYGIEMKKDAVLDWQRSVRLPVMTQTGAPAWIRAPAIVQTQHDPRFDDEHQLLDDGFAAFFRADELSFPFPSTLVPHADKQPEAKLKVVARTTTAAWAETADTVDLKISPTWRAKPPLDQRAIGIAVEGTLHAALGPGDGVEVPSVSKEKSRVLVISAAGFLTNPFARSGSGTELGGQFAMMGPVGGDEQLQMIAQPYAQKYLTGTILSFKNTLDWMSGDSDLIAASAKILGEANLTYADINRPKLDASDDENSIKKKDEEYRDARKNTQRNVQLTLTLLCPLLFAGFGIFRWRQREGGRANISLD